MPRRRHRKDDAAHTVALIRALRGARLNRPRRRIPRPLQPDTVRLTYYQRLVALLATARGYVARELSLELGMHFDKETGPPPGPRVNRAIERAAARFYDQAFHPREAEALAEQIAQRTSDWSRVQWQRQVRAGLGVDMLSAEPNLRPLVDGFVGENVALIKSIPSQFFDDLEKVISRSVADGVRHEDIARDIAERYGVAEDRAALIARDQCGSLMGKLAGARQQALGIRAYFWRGMNDERERPEHVDREGQRFEWDNPPEDGNPGEPIQCRCWAEPDMSDLLSEAA